MLEHALSLRARNRVRSTLGVYITLQQWAAWGAWEAGSGQKQEQEQEHEQERRRQRQRQPQAFN